MPIPMPMAIERKCQLFFEEILICLFNPTQAPTPTPTSPPTPTPRAFEAKAKPDTTVQPATPQCGDHTDDNISQSQTTNAEPKHNVYTPQQTPSRRRASTVTLNCFIESVAFGCYFESSILGSAA